jgi:dynein heavy chain, axonemal
MWQNSVKMTNEPPRGVKANLAASFQDFTDAYFEKQPKEREFKKLLYGTCFFHALLQDRRKFGPLGFNIRYEFTTGDLKCCILQLENFLARYEEVPYEVLVNLIGHINYGGRITDDWDRRMVLVMLKSIIKDSIMSDETDLAPGGLYPSPRAGKLVDYQQAITKLPINPHPNIFGLHENADIACANNETQELCDIILSLQPKVSSGGGKSRDDVVREVATALTERNIKPFNIVDVMERYPLTYTESMNTVLTQEVGRFNKLIKVFNRSLADLLKALKGLVVMSAELDAMATSLFTNAVPSMWSKVGYPSLKPLAAWVEDLVLRIAFIDKWIEQGTPVSYWLPGFFFPQAFLTGTLSNYARKYEVAIDSVTFGFHVMQNRGDDIIQKPDDGCYIYGCFLEGAGWDPIENVLIESNPKELFVPFPAIWLEPIVDRQPPSGGVYSCPMYKTLTRAGTLSTTGHSTNFVLMVELPSADACEGQFHKYCEEFSCHWIKRAVALFTSLNY